MKKFIYALGAFTCLAFNVQADIATDVKSDLAEALPKTRVDKVEPSEIPGLFRITSGANVFYYYPEKRLTVFGEVMTTDGKNLTFSHRESARKSELTALKESAYTVTRGEPINVVYEFSNPECGACLHHESYLADHPMENTVRHIFFLSWNESSRQKVEHILCSPDQEAARQAVYGRKGVTEFATCEHGRDLVKKHDAVAKALGVNRTPTLIVNGTRVIGSKPEAINNLLKSENQNELSKHVQSD